MRVVVSQIAVLLAIGLALPTSLAQSQDPAVVADPTEAIVEVGSTFTVDYWVEAAPGSACPATPLTPVRLSVHTASLLGIFPFSFDVVACDTPYPITVTASGVGVATIIVSATGGTAGFYTTDRAVTTAYVHSADDADPPRIVVPTEVVEEEAIGPLGALVYVSVSATDNQTSPPQVTCEPTGPWYPLGLTRVDCHAVDANGNLGRAHYFVRVVDTTPPSLVVPPDLDVWPTGWPDVTFATFATDLVWGATPVECTPSSGSRFPVGATLVRCSSTDGSGNTANASFTVRVHDVVAPQVVGPDVTAEATGPNGAAVAYNASAFDFIDPAPTISCAPPSGSVFALGTTTVMCTARDASGNNATRGLVVRVVDTTPPVLSIPSVVTRELTSPAGATVAWSSTSNDLVSGPRIVRCTPSSGSIFPLGTTPVACMANDAAGNVATGTLSVVVRDTRVPRLTLPADLTVEATSPSGAPVTFAATATDESGTATVTCAPASGAVFPLGTTSVACTARDASGNAASGAFQVSVVDTTPPVLELPAEITTNATSPTGANVTWVASASDLVSLSTPVHCVPASGWAFAVGTTRVTCTSTDAAGNTATAGFDVTVLPLRATCGADGWKAPIGTPGHFATGIDVFRAGSSIPLKLDRSCLEEAGLQPRLSYAHVRADGSLADAQPGRSRAQEGDRFDATGNHWHYVWDTRGLAPATYRLLVDLGPEGVLVRDVRLR